MYIFSQGPNDLSIFEKDNTYGPGGYQKDKYTDLIILQTRVIAQPFFTSHFAARLEDALPKLEANARRRIAKDERERRSLGQFGVSRNRGVVQGGTDVWRAAMNLIVRMPERLFALPSTDENEALARRLRGWYVEAPLEGYDPLAPKSELLRRARDEAARTNRSEGWIWEIEWYMEADEVRSQWH